jgi:UDP-glucose 4-epimerase
MKVLITGGMGVIGAETTRKFIKEGHRPVVFARHRDDSLIGDIADKFDFEQGDVLDLPRILQAIKTHKVTHVVHAAAFVGAVSAANPALSIQVNVVGLVNVLEAARALGVQRVVFTSAKGVYGPVTGEYGSPTWKPMSEDLPAKPKRIYDSAKFMGENVCAYYNDNMGIETVSLRFASTYGPGKTARHGPMAVMSRIVENPANGLAFKLEKGGDFEHVIKKHIPNAQMEIGGGLNFYGFAYPATGIYDISRAREELGYKPEYDLERGIADYLAALKQMKAAA